MGLFAGQKLVAHDAYEFMGSLYSHRMTDWLKGIPWYFYYVLIAVKLPVLTLAGCAIGLTLLFKRKIGDGRYFILFWMFFWLITFSFVGGKFTRYFTVALPAVLITAAIGVQFVARWIAQRLSTLVNSEAFRIYARLAVSLVVVVASLKAAVNVAPHFRLYTNVLGGGAAKAGYYFPHDEFYDASVRDVMFEIARRARPGAQIASESSTLASYYAKRAGRLDLVCVNLSDPRALKQLREGDFIIDARGRRYFSNQAIISALEQASSQAFRMSLGPVPSASVYQLDKHSLETVVETARTLPPLAKRFTEFKLPDTHF
jgi:hypothetical protein